MLRVSSTSVPSLTWTVLEKPKCQGKRSGDVRTGKQETPELYLVLTPHTQRGRNERGIKRPGMHLGHTWGTAGVCFRVSRGTSGTYLRHIWDTLEVYVGHSWESPGAQLKDTWGHIWVYLEHTWDTSGVHLWMPGPVEVSASGGHSLVCLFESTVGAQQMFGKGCQERVRGW